MLEKINSPKDLKKLSLGELNDLRREIRYFLLKCVSETGGHLAPSLGVVELTMALHYVFDSPKDKIVWDVGHQAYVHKLLTGRKKGFKTLRQYKGMSGFPKTKESPHDAFNVGHASTSISAALGMAKARDFKGEKNKVVAIIGDGSLGGGMALEGLNNAGSLGSDLIVILNDNRMSISPNVGAISRYLRRITMKPVFIKVKQKGLSFFDYLFGSKAAKRIVKLERTIRSLRGQGAFFKELGYNYFGPIDGHNLDTLISALMNIKQLGGPILLHVVTKKGKGYYHAEKNAPKFHGIGPFNIANGEKNKKSDILTYTQAFSNTMIKIAKRNPRVVAITAAMPAGTGLDKFAKEFPRRFFDVGICEQHAVTFSAGLAIKGMKPVCTIYSTFLQRSYDQIVHDVCMQNLPVVFAMDRGGLVGYDGETHHGAFDLSYLRHIPNMVVMAPKDENELQHMLFTAVNHKGPIALRYPRGTGIGVKLDQQLKNIPIGECEILTPYKDVVIVTVGPLVYEALEAQKKLMSQGIKAMVINARFIKPVSREIIKLIGKIGKAVIIEENAVQGGFGSAILEELAKQKIKAKVELIGIPDSFIEHGSQKILRKICGLTKENIVEKVKQLL